MGTANTVCADWQWFEDDAGHSTIENAHTDLSSPDSYLDTTIGLRILLDNTGSKDETDGYKIMYSINAGVDWYDITTSSSYVKAVNGSQHNDGDSTSQELGSGTFDEGYWDEDGGVASYTLAQGQESENEHYIQFISGDCPGNTVEIKVVFDGGADVDGYTYSDPSTTFSAADVYVTPGAAESRASAEDPTPVLGSITLTPGVAESNASAEDPTPVLGTISITPDVAEALASGEDPVVVLGSITITPNVVESRASAEDPGVQAGGDEQVTPGAADSNASSEEPVVLLGTITLTPDVAEALASAEEPAVVLTTITLTPDVAEALAWALDPTVSIPGEEEELQMLAINLLWLGVGGKRNP